MLNSFLQCALKSLIWLNFQVRVDCVEAGLSCRDCHDQPNSQIRLNPPFYSARAGMQKCSGFGRSLGNLQRNFRRNMEGGRNNHRTARIGFWQLGRLDESAVGFPVSQQQIAQLRGDVIQPMPRDGLPTEPCTHDTQRRGQCPGHGSDCTPGRNGCGSSNLFDELRQGELARIL